MKIMKKITAGAVCAAMVGSMAVAASATEAGVTFCTAAWVFRNNFDQSRVANCDTALNDEGIFSEDEFGQKFGEDCFALDGDIEDAEITGDGTYTAKITNISATNKAGLENTAFNWIRLSTDINLEEYPDTVITLTSVKLGGTEMLDKEWTYDYVADNDIPDFDTYIENTYAEDPTRVDKSLKLAGIPLCNIWVDAAALPLALQAEKSDTIDFADSIEITFEVTGLDAPEEPTEPETPVEPETPEEPTTGDTSKPSTDTGVEGVAAVAGIAVLAAGAVIVAKKRK